MRDLKNELVKLMNHPGGAIGRMRDIESEEGHTPIPYGASEPISFSKADWLDGVISLSKDRASIRIVAIAARNPGKGAFTRLVAEIKDRGYQPVVLAPMGPVMPALMKRWGWQKRIVGSGFMATDEWVPFDPLSISKEKAVG